MTELNRVEVHRITAGDAQLIAEASHLFDAPPQPETTASFLARPGHHLLIAYHDGVPAGFASGVEVAHPDKAVELLLYELGVDERYRRHGFGTALVRAMVRLAASLGCRSMWVPVDEGDTAAIATYRAGGAGPPEDATIMTWDLL